MTQFIDRKLFPLLIFIFCVSGSVFGREIYVDNMRGNDAFLGFTQRAGSENGPVRTISRAIALASRGDTIILANNPEPYRESVLISGEKVSGIPGYPLRIHGNGATLDGAVEVSPNYWKSLGRNGIFFYRPEFTAHQNLFYRGKPIKRLDTSNISSLEELLKLDWQPMTWALYRGHVYFKPKDAGMISASERFLPYDGSQAAKKRAYSLTAPGLRHGISLFHVHNIEIRDLTVQGFQEDGIVASDAASQIQLENITCRGNARCGIAVGTGCSLWLKNCVLGNNQKAQLLTEEASLVSLFATDLISYPAPGWVDQGGTVFRDKKRIEGGLDEKIESGGEDDPNYYGDQTVVEETELKEEELGNDDEEAEVSDDDSEDSSPFGDDDEESDESEDFGADSEDSDMSDDGGFDFGDDDDESNGDDSEEDESDDFDGEGENEEDDAEDKEDSEDDGGFDFGGDEDSENEGESEDSEEDGGGFSF